MSNKNWETSLKLIGSQSIICDGSLFWDNEGYLSAASIGIVDMEAMVFFHNSLDIQILLSETKDCEIPKKPHSGHLILRVEFEAICKALSLFPGYRIFNDSQNAIAIAKSLNPKRNLCWLPRAECGFAHQIAKSAKFGKGKITLKRPAPTRDWLLIEYCQETENA